MPSMYELIAQGKIVYFLTVLCISALLVVLLLWHVAQAFLKRLWLLPSHSSGILALNAGTLALLGIVAKPLKPGDDALSGGLGDENYMLASIVLICAAIGAFMPSLAASTELHDMWSNLVGVGVLVMSVMFITFLQFFYIHYDGVSDHQLRPTIHETAMEHIVVMASLFLLFLVLLVQAVALEAMMSDMKAIVMQRLDQLSMEFEAKPAYEANVSVERRAWSWEVVDQNTRIKLMMALTSDPQSLMSRSPSAAIVGALVLLCVTLFLKHNNGQLFVYQLFQAQAIAVCGLICVWRWVRVALQEDRSFSSLVFAAEPSYWRRKARNLHCFLNAGPRNRKWGFQEVLSLMWYTTAFSMLCFAAPFHRFLVALIRFTQILSALLVQKLMWLPINTLWCSIVVLWRAHFQRSSSNRVADGVVADVAEMSSTSFDSLGVACLEGEDARIVRSEFVSAANTIIRKQLKKSKKKSYHVKDLISHLKGSFNASTIVAGKSKAIFDAMSQEGAPFIANLRVKHGYQFGWTLIALSLLELLGKIEVTTAGASTVFEVAMNACQQAMDMMQLVDEQFSPCLVCSQDIYVSACTSAWSQLQKKKRRWTTRMNQARKEVRLDGVSQALKCTLRSTTRHIEEFNNAQKSPHGSNVSVIWSQEALNSYTMHTVCQNLLTSWVNDVEAVATIVKENGGVQERSASRKMIEGMVDHINGLIGEVVACCLSNLPTAVDMSTTQAVQSGKINKIEKALLFVVQGKHIWEELQWPIIYSHKDTGLGQVKQWMH